MKFAAKVLLLIYTVAVLCNVALPFLSGRASAVTSPNLIANPSVETAQTGTSLPQSWLQGGWGTNTTAFTYNTTSGHTGTHSVSVKMTKYTSGDAKWYFTPVAVTAGTTYSYGDYYESTVATELVAQFDDGNGNYTYQTLSTPTASASSWATANSTFTVPAGEKNVTIFHLINSVGSLTTDDFSLTATSAPAVSITSPTASSTVAGTATLSASASDTTGISSVQFAIDGTSVGSPVTTVPYQTSWNSTTATNGTHTVTATATNAEGISTTSSPVSVTVYNAPVVGSNLIPNASVETASTSTTPANWSNGGWGTNTASYSYLNTGHTGTHSVNVQISSYTSGDAKWYPAPVTVPANTSYNFSDYYEATVATDVVAQFEDTSGNYTYQDLGTAPLSSTWKQYTATFTTPANTANVTIFHLINSVGSLTTDDYSLTSAPLSTAPMVNITTPTSNFKVIGTQQLTASASAVGGNSVSSVQFQVDGDNVGSALTTSPYSTIWDSSLVSNGTHSITAIATAANGQTTTSAPVSVTVANVNLIPNPSLETADPNDSNSPEDWNSGSWGTNTTTFSYLNTGHTGTHSINATVSNYSNGGADWTYNPVPVTAGKLYEFTEYYQSNATTEADLAVTMSNGTIDYIWLGNPYSSVGTWTKFFAEFTMPAGAVSAAAYQSIYANGYFTADDYDFQAYTPVGFSQPMVSVTFDDSIASQYTNGLPVLQKYGLKGTFYTISGDVGICDPNVSSICYMSQSQVEALNTAGQEVGSHTVDHPDLTTLTTSAVDQELSTSQSTIEGWLGGKSVTDFAAPYGDVNLSVLNEVSKYYVSQRGVEAGYNSVDNYDQSDLLVQDVDTSTTVAQVEAYINYAKSSNTWLILVYHDIDTDNTVDPGYNTTPANFSTEMAYLKNSGIDVPTMTQGIAAVTPQVTQ